MTCDDPLKKEANRLIETSRALIAKIEKLIAKSGQHRADNDPDLTNEDELGPDAPQS
jgi:hypothetical protein